MRPFIAEVVRVDSHDPFIEGERVIITKMGHLLCTAHSLQGMSYTNGLYMNNDQIERVPSNIGTLTLATLISLKTAIHDDFIS